MWGTNGYDMVVSYDLETEECRFLTENEEFPTNGNYEGFLNSIEDDSSWEEAEDLDEVLGEDSIFAERIVLSDEEMDNIGSYMDDDIREELHAKIAPCDPDFETLLWQEFRIEL